MRSEAQPRVLFLDDDPGILSLVAARLRDAPIHLIECSEIEAAEVLLDHLKFDVLIVDLEVSELGGLEGIRLIRHAASHFSDTRVLVFSGQVTPLARRLAASLGVTEVLEKPGDLGRLVDLVRDLTTDPFATPADGAGHRLTTVERLEEIIHDKRISSVFQPIFQLRGNGEVSKRYGFEALSRGPQESPLRNPMVLFEYAVRKELAFQVDSLCLQQALSAARSIQNEGVLFINSHPRAMSHPDYVPALEDALLSCDIKPSRVVLEVTEQSAILDTRELAEILRQARSRGVKVALDDYGEGSSNLHLIHDLRPEFLKVSGIFCDGIDEENAKQALVRSAARLAHDLGMATVMERIETARQLDAVRALGIEFGQGYHLGHPVSPHLLGIAGARSGDSGSPQPGPAAD